jgi:hypothetical protein
MFAQVGNALLRIRDAKLYRENHRTFEDYCRGRWKMSARRGRQLIDAANVFANIQNGNSCSHSALPQNESVVRPLADLSVPDQQGVWTEAHKKANGHPTAEQVKESVKALVPSERKTKRHAGKIWNDSHDSFCGSLRSVPSTICFHSSSVNGAGLQP